MYTFLYYVVITPVGAVSRLFGAKSGESFRPDLPTYWRQRSDLPPSPDTFHSQSRV